MSQDKPQYTQHITVDVIGDSTGERYQGVFVVKTRFSHRERLMRDQYRRQLLGPQPDGAVPNGEASGSAEVFSQLSMRIVEAPHFWTASANGLDLIDSNVVTAVYDEAIKAEIDAIKAVQKKAEEAKRGLKDVNVKE